MEAMRFVVRLAAEQSAPAAYYFNDSLQWLHRIAES
jgi:hypothetical protein